MTEIAARFALSYDWDKRQRVIAGREVVVHCHHYNSRVLHTIESARGIDGKQVIRAAAESVFAEYVASVIAPGDDLAMRWAVATRLYCHLGLGRLETTADGAVVAPSSHFALGWNASFAARTQPVCTFTEGFLAGAHAAVTGEVVAYRETACRAAGAAQCRFEPVREARAPIAPVTRTPFPFTPARVAGRTRNIDADRIVRAVVGMPIEGNAEGLIPALGVYLASMPADFYNLVSIRFVEEMAAKGLGRNAQRLLVSDAETSALHTFRGIAGSPEWRALVAPMVQDTPDKVHGAIAVASALGWGHWVVTNHSPDESLRLESAAGYEASGYRTLRGAASEPRCFVLRGAAAAIMAFVYGAGTAAQRVGTYVASELDCISCGAGGCRVEVRRS